MSCCLQKIIGRKKRMNQNQNDQWVVFEYEVQMYWQSRVVLAKRLNPTSNEELIIKNALVESSMLHSRVLIDILLSRGPRSDDIHLEHLVTDWQSTDLKTIIDKLKFVWGTSSQPNTPCWTLNKMLAHGTNLRADRFDYGALANSIDPIVWEAIHQIAKITGRIHLLDFLT